MKLILTLAIGLLTLSAYAQTPPRYTVTDLGTLGGLHGASEGTALNDAGQVVGSYQTDDGDVPPYPFLWEKGRMRRIGHFQGTPHGINAKGVVVGGKDDLSETGPAFVYSSHQIHLLRTLGGKSGTGKAVNDASAVVGEASLGSSPGEDGEDYVPHHAVLWQAGHVYDLQSLAVTEANAINNRGEVVGRVQGKREELPMLLRGRTVQKLPLLRKFASATPNAISDRGEVVGSAELDVKPGADGARPTRAVAWLHGKMYDLGRLDGESSQANGVNDAGLIVGSAETKEEGPHGTALPHAILWRNRRLYDLNKCVSRHSGWEFVEAAAINRRGQIVGYGYHNHSTRAFLLTPITK